MFIERFRYHILERCLKIREKKKQKHAGERVVKGLTAFKLEDMRQFGYKSKKKDSKDK